MKKVLVGGCFNKIHPGHVYFLKEAKKLGDYLIVVLTNDRNNKPYGIPAKQRKKNLEKINMKLKLINKIVIGDPNDFSKVVKKEKPDVIALGYDQKLPEGVSKEIKKIIVKRIKKFGNYSTKLNRF